MKTFRLSQSSSDSIELEPNVTAVGFFDGIHKGHQQVISTAVKKAQQLSLKSAVMTFDPHPSVVLKKEKQHAQYITPLKEKEEILENMGVDYLFVVHFDKDLAALSPQSFVDEYFASLKVEHVVAGYDFSYGHKGKGSMETLPEHAKGRFTHTVVRKVAQDEDKVSSTRIRTLLDEGNVSEVQKLLGRKFSVRGERREDTSSACFSLAISSSYYLPHPGIYAVTISDHQRDYKGMAIIEDEELTRSETMNQKIYLHCLESPVSDVPAEFIVYFHQLIREENLSEQLSERSRQREKAKEDIRQFFRIG
ncbi:riboflavin biosynthesis protein [Halobacillus halophilus DSM 2266]|uniref:Riboflavin biosynthesis protein n=1 Tax=Halobacillus halophilus (strain ATCC 35676 / DSM 2266 / JCM 20832 / KCTC 3685 / LMG 17431 / NBRC 102448 / NCIMB 2269) TaxID=866895 RepID=I0JMQ9_HALH3|nr:FAD synthetase family protein [Halobacillus halophilus]CCG45429.1 riboflavin biosynthesis protein [Halobacillus halophilus DSM 2266]